MNPMYEKIVPNQNSSWRYWFYQSDKIPFIWHYHPEYEICLTLNSKGMRHIGDQITTYDHLDLTLLGPNIPHTWDSTELIEPTKHHVYVAQIPATWIESIAEVPDLLPLKELLNRSTQGIDFSIEAALLCLKKFEAMANASQMQRFILLLDIFQLMIEDSRAEIICSSGYKLPEIDETASAKIDKVINFINEHYTTDIGAEQVAQLIHMSTNHFHQFFKKHTEKTFTEMVNELRIGKSCALLLSSDLPISIISERSGFKNISNFNRRFLQLKKCSPREFKDIYAV
jgi:AraC-like DNA-binding protein